MGYTQVVPSENKWLNGISFINMANSEGFNLSDLVPTSKGKVTTDQFRTWWWNNDPEKGPLGNNEVIWNSFYYLGDNEELPIRPGDEGLVEDGYVWLSEPEDYVWTDNKEADFPIRCTDKVFRAGEGFFSKPTCEEPSLLFPNPFYKPE